MYEFLPEVASTFIYSIEFMEVPVDLKDIDDKEWPVAKINGSDCVTISKRIDHKKPHGFTVRVATFGNDISEIQTHVRASEVRWGNQYFDGWRCNPTLVSDVMEVKRMDPHGTEVVYHDLRRMIEELVERM
ncbi:hypothetical protein GCM10011332_29270 [Terasakiella brassicae]|uniref:Uncharacterized protein n=1 Tax=Terasakiella brassicae TaxID=1634917 RepID=A0A917C5P3_9PROT|nr:hypothetical protein [Terasakiella brassicae]GGF73362.1 hypothetical protein GCM10011332_29270 [Terasakiella brassicae]